MTAAEEQRQRIIPFSRPVRICGRPDQLGLRRREVR
jgi:hypothetical protein